jgi:DNA-binding PadR family transcriptional regulator
MTQTLDPRTEELGTLEAICTDTWMPYERVPYPYAKNLERQGLIRYHGPCHGYVVTDKGRAVVAVLKSQRREGSAA